MANNNYKFDEMIRPRSVYLTSELVPNDADASSAIYQLSESIYAQDGHDLVFGVRSFGFNASCTNISRIQGNNTLQISVTRSQAAYVYDPIGDLYISNPESSFIYETIYTIVFPEGLYTLEELFEVLSSVDNYKIPSGYKYDIRSENKLIENKSLGVMVDNDIFLTLKFEILGSGFKVTPCFVGVPIQNQYQDANENYYSAWNVNPQVKRVTILRDPQNPKLYDLLFTNQYSDAMDHPGEVPQYETNIRGFNPPTSIEFDCYIKLFDSGLTPLDLEPLSSVSVQDSLEIIQVKYYPDTSIMISLDAKYPNNGFMYPNRGAVFYHKPSITPFYIDVESDLETYNVSLAGNLKGLLVRQFALGSGNGGTSFFQFYDNPVFFKMSSSRESIDSIRISFRSEGNKWNFFNMEFFLELMVFEYPKESFRRSMLLQQSNYNQSGNSNNQLEYTRATDEITSAMGPLHNSFPFRHRGSDQSVVYFRDSQRSGSKRGFEWS